MPAAQPAAVPAAWITATDATAPASGGSANVSTPRYPGALATYHGPPQQYQQGGWPFGMSPATPNAGAKQATANPAETPQLGSGQAEPIVYPGIIAPGAGKPPNSFPGHDGYGGTAQEMARHGVDDGSAYWFGRAATGLAVNISTWWNTMTKRMPTDWRSIRTGPIGQVENYEFDRPSLDNQPRSERDMTVHTVDYEAAPIYLHLAQVAQAQGVPDPYGYRAPYGYEPDLAGGQYTNNAGNPVYDAPPDPVVIPVNPAPVNYGLSDLYG